MDPYQIIFIINEDIDNVSFKVNYLRTLVCQSFPNVLIDFKNVDVLHNTTKCDTNSFRYCAFFIVLYDQTSRKNLLDLEKLQDRYVELFPRSPRPKWLTLLSTDNSDHTREISLALEKSWKNKFMDITIVQTDFLFDDLVVHHYNPFKKHLTQQQYSKDTADVFPDKMREMNGYSLSTIFYADPPGISITEANDVPKISGIDYWIIKTVSHVLNFTLKVYDLGKFNFSGMMSAMREGSIDFSGNQIYFWNNEPFDKSTILKPDGYCVVVPVIQVPSARAKSRLYFGLLLTLFHIFIIVNASKLLRFDRKIWTWINVFEIILGMPAPKLPPSIGERSFVGCIIVLSLTYTSVFYARMTDSNFKATEEAPLNNFVDLDNSGLIPLVHKDLYNVTFDVFDNQSVVMKNLKRKARIWDDAISCVDELSKNKTIACIMSEQLGNFLINNYRDSDGMLTMRVMQPCFWITWRGYAFAPGSPYQEKFDAIMIRIFESGLIKKWTGNKGLASARRKSLTLDTGFIFEHMYVILKAGYFLSCFTFFVELIVYYFLS
ncbi:uncharacterized protein LOC131666433 [Phymastichus coffea]|uniref:uncharacterized protein LOC131666433 n=1 Tax=Phymastichus coffea TaxID=108790 RepID=UPI00273C60B0|nr:uncharacterized protein LOC131666433 [Phymastichus coffea]